MPVIYASKWNKLTLKLQRIELQYWVNMFKNVKNFAWVRSVLFCKYDVSEASGFLSRNFET